MNLWYSGEGKSNAAFSVEAAAVAGPRFAGHASLPRASAVAHANGGVWAVSFSSSTCVRTASTPTFLPACCGSHSYRSGLRGCTVCDAPRTVRPEEFPNVLLASRHIVTVLLQIIQCVLYPRIGIDVVLHPLSLRIRFVVSILCIAHVFVLHDSSCAEPTCRVPDMFFFFSSELAGDTHNRQKKNNHESRCGPRY